MPQDPRYDILFEPVKIGPVTAKNRFYQVPHCNGMGHAYPSSMAEMRSVKAEGGWAVVCTEEVEIHPSSEHSPIIEGRLWDDADIPVFARMNEKIHEHGSLAGIEPAYSGFTAANLYSREIPMAPSHRPVEDYHPVQARMMDKTDIKNLRHWYVNAAKRSKKAGFDIIYVYAGHDLSVPMHFMSPRHNQRIDEYGGSFENRIRLFREILEETKDAVGDTCAVVVRYAVDELMGSAGLSSLGEGRDFVERLAEEPDLWDVNVSDWANDSSTSRFSEMGNQEPFISFVKTITSKPVVGVGRYTSPDAMVSLVKRGVLDLIGAARPSIADPFLPRKIEEGRVDDIRECIGCNICVSGDFLSTPMRCTQNPTAGEEWRKGWHPERIAKKTTDESVLIVGTGPSGLECAQALGKRGYSVTIVEATTEIGGRVKDESRLPGLAEWGRVRDYREGQILNMLNVELFLDSRLNAAHILEFGADHVVLATGSKWRKDGVGRKNRTAVLGSDGDNVFTPDDVIAGCEITGPVIIFDDDHYYMGGIMAEKLRKDDIDVILVTPAADVSHWTHNTLEQERIQTRLIEIGVEIIPLHNITSIAKDKVELGCVYTNRPKTYQCVSVLMVTARLPEDDLYYQLMEKSASLSSAGNKSVTRIGDCLAPGTIAAAVYSGHRYARMLNEPEHDNVPFRRELSQLADA
ncbi:NADH:flavin oxidoreductase [Alphaproteobacteria bacterium 46_93_T64]|nr:NADH:flavin oxidoreductase [Alphaproteobacteria bacterium 46_93_T64]